MTERNFFGSSLIMADSMVKYKSQGYLGDEILIKLSITEHTSHGFQIFYLLKNKKKQIDLAYIQTSLVFYNYELEKIVPTPDDFKIFLKNYNSYEEIFSFFFISIYSFSFSLQNDSLFNSKFPLSPPFLTNNDSFWVDSILSKMSIEEKIAQSFFVRANSHSLMKMKNILKKLMI